MFKKKPQIKPLAPLRSSDRRKTADQIIKDLDIKASINDNATPEEKAASTAAHTTLRNSLLPDNALSARFTTTHGPDLKLVSGTVYVGSHNGEEQRVLWAKINDRMYPTVYTLWHNPGILPLLHTGSFVVDKLQGGADLMTPGLYGGPPFPKNAKKGSIVAVSSAENPSVPLVVGYCEIDVSTLQKVQGAKGHAVRTIHWSGDELWSWSASGNPGLSPPGKLDRWIDKDIDIDELDKQADQLAVNEDEGEQEGGVALGFEEQKEPNGGQDEEEDILEMTTKEIDDAFRNAFLYGIHHHKTTNPKLPNFGIQFPLTQSLAMSSLVQPFLPTFTASQTAQLQIKKTSWKTMKKFLKSLDKSQIVKTKDLQGNEVVVLDIDFEDDQVLNFKPYRLPKKETAPGPSNGKATEQSDPSDPSVGQKLKLLSVFKAKDKLAPIFAASKSDIRSYFSAADLRPIITTYIESENLISPTNKRFVTLNPVLANAVFDGKGASDKEILARGVVPREILIERFLQSSCSAYHLIQRTPTTSATENQKPRAGAPPKLLITLETRSGNKVVTKVSGVEAYFIMPQPLADELRKVCAGSTSVERLQGSSPKTPIMEIMIQGPQKDAVIKALEKRGVDKRWVEVVDKVKKKK